jgi:uncharacterized NAD(P)/FAD-binding protein YdhS
MQNSSLVIQTNLPANRLQSGKCYDLAIIGAGISSAYTLIHYIELLEQESSAIDNPHDRQPVKIIVTEKSGEFWTGIPYGSRSGRSCLLISPLIEFIPQPLERAHFTDWLNDNRDRLFDPQADNEGELTTKWLQANHADIISGRWDDLFIPRQIFGSYLKERVASLLAAATSKGLIEIDLVAADVLDVQRDRVITNAEGGTYFTTKKLVLAIGSPPNVAFERVTDEAANLCYIDNMYEPSLESNLARICQSLAQQPDRQILIVGSNAGTLDTLYSLNDSSTLTNLVEKFIILSPNAAFPHRISREVPSIDYTPEALVALLETTPFTAKQIFEAVRLDVAAASAKQINISDIHGQISKVTMQALNLLDVAEQQQFVSIYAVEIGKLQRRAGGEYLDVVNTLVSQDKLTFIKGKFVKDLLLTTGGSVCEYIDSDDREHKILDTPLGVIINCAGFQDVTKSSSILIQNLLQRGICAPNDSNRGFVIDKNFEASKNCYVMGPLVAGNIDGSFRIWHAESCQRIIGLSQHLATVLIQPDPAELAPAETTTAADSIGVLVNVG